MVSEMPSQVHKVTRGWPRCLGGRDERWYCTLFWYETLSEAAVGISRMKFDSDIKADTREMEYHVKFHPRTGQEGPEGE